MKKVYLIEDDQFLQKLILRKLMSADFEINSAPNWDIAKEVITEFKPDVLILDLMLPVGIDGFEILKYVRSKHAFKDTMIIVFSNMASDDSEKKAIELGANAYMIKSNFTLDELVDKVNELAK
ncbi:MAG: response regulator [Candidatus Pacebacteria bacterium]|nr:response regulator [Candidatus Paceibacterota bacterium]